MPNFLQGGQASLACHKSSLNSRRIQIRPQSIASHNWLTTAFKANSFAELVLSVREGTYSKYVSLEIRFVPCIKPILRSCSPNISSSYNNFNSVNIISSFSSPGRFRGRCRVFSCLGVYRGLVYLWLIPIQL